MHTVALLLCVTSPSFRRGGSEDSKYVGAYINNNKWHGQALAVLVVADHAPTYLPSSADVKVPWPWGGAGAGEGKAGEVVSARFGTAVLGSGKPPFVCCRPARLALPLQIIRGPRRGTHHAPFFRRPLASSQASSNAQQPNSCRRRAAAEADKDYVEAAFRHFDIIEVGGEGDVRPPSKVKLAPVLFLHIR